MLKNSCNYRTKFKWINASSNFAISVHIDQDWDSNPEELIFVNFHEVTLFFNNEFAEAEGFEPPCQLITDLMIFKTILFTDLSTPPK